jgi:hypothetical protein
VTADRTRIVRAGLLTAGGLAWLFGVGADALGAGGSEGYHARQIVTAQVGIALILAGALYGSARLPQFRRPQWHLRRPSLPVAAAGGAALAFVAVSVWWLIADGWVPNGDAGRHLLIVNNYLQAVEGGDLWRPLDSPPVIDEEFYPPFVHLVGVLGSLVGSYGVVSGVLTLNFIFVPLLALGCFATASRIYGRWAGALAVVFVLGAPILIAQFHVFMLDASLTALVAVSVWLLLASDRFARPAMAALAGLAVGFGIMTKVTFPLFVAGVVAVILFRGGWRNWRGLALFLGVALLVSQPWLMLHEDMLRDRAERAINMQRENPHAQGTFGNYGAYFWGVLTVQLLAPLFLFFLVGFGRAVWRAVKRRDSDGELELVAGVVVGVVAVASMDWFNVRYNMPLLPYAAVLGVGWVTAIGRVPVRLALAAAVVVIAVTNSVMVNSGAGGLVKIGLPFTDRHATLVSDGGYVENQPRGEVWVPELLEAAREAGARQVIFHPESMNTGYFNLNGLAVFGRMADLSVRPPYLWHELSETDVYLTRLDIAPSRPDPCIRLEGDRGIYVYRGGPPEGRTPWCPPGWQQRIADL